MEMLDYVKKTPDKVAENISNKEKLVTPLVDLFKANNFENVLIVASGSSLNAAMMATAYMEKRLQCSVTTITPELFELKQNVDFKNSFILFISQSGASTNILHALKYMDQVNAKKIVLTSNLKSEVAQHVDAAIDYGVGNETVGYVTMGLSTLILYLAMFANEAAITQGRESDSEEDFKQLSVLYKKTIEQSLKFVEQHYLDLAEMEPTFICGNDMNFGVAREAALKFQETLKIPTMHYEIEEFMHGPDIQLSPQYTVFLIDNPEASERIKAIHHGLSAVINKRYLLTNNDQQVKENTILIPKSPIKELTALITIPFFQVIAARMMPDLKREPAHPFTDKFMDNVPTKDYTQVE